MGAGEVPLFLLESCTPALVTARSESTVDAPLYIARHATPVTDCAAAATCKGVASFKTAGMTAGQMDRYTQCDMPPSPHLVLALTNIHCTHAMPYTGSREDFQ